MPERSSGKLPAECNRCARTDIGSREITRETLSELDTGFGGTTMPAVPGTLARRRKQVRAEKLIPVLTAGIVKALPDSLAIPKRESPVDLPVTEPFTAPNRSGDEHAIVLPDPSGRIRDARLFSMLGWKPGTTVTVDLGSGHLTAVADTAGLTVLDPRGRLQIPAAIRVRWHMGTDNRFLLSLINDTLVINRLSVLGFLTGER